MPRWPEQPLAERFFAKTQRCPETGCLLWTGALKKPSRRDTRGGQSLPHGKFKVDDKVVAAHRVAFALAHGHAGYTLEFFGLLAHECDTPGCVEAEHLSESDHSGNLFDAYNRGRRYEKALVELCDWFDANPMWLPEAAE